MPLNGAIGPRPSLRQWADARIAHSEVTAPVVDVSRAVACQPGIVRLDGIISGLPTGHRPSTQGSTLAFRKSPVRSGSPPGGKRVMTCLFDFGALVAVLTSGAGADPR